MKASIKFREEQKPLIRAKIPLNVLSFPFQSGVVAGESKELSLNLATLFDSGPSFKFSYRPNDSQNPFSLIFKTGIGHFGSPTSSPFTMSAQFNLVGNQNPSFYIHFKPQFGDFSIKKSHCSSDLVRKVESKSSIDGGFESLTPPPPPLPGYFSAGKKLLLGGTAGFLPAESQADGVLKSVLSGAQMRARTSLPLRDSAVLNFRWGIRFPPGETTLAEETDAVMVGKSDMPAAGVSFKRFPLLVMNKIGIEHVAKEERKDFKVGPLTNLPGNPEVTEAYLNVKKQLEGIQTENGLLAKALNDLKSEIAAGKLNLSAGSFDAASKRREAERSSSRCSPDHGHGGRLDNRSKGETKVSEWNSSSGKVTEEDPKM